MQLNCLNIWYSKGVRHKRTVPGACLGSDLLRSVFGLDKSENTISPQIAKETIPALFTFRSEPEQVVCIWNIQKIVLSRIKITWPEPIWYANIMQSY